MFMNLYAYQFRTVAWCNIKLNFYTVSVLLLFVTVYIRRLFCCCYNLKFILLTVA